MIRKLAIVAALAAIPTLAAAQTYTSDAEVIIRGQAPDSYSIVISTAGKDPYEVREEIRDASYAACARAPLTGNAADFHVDITITCVNQAQSGALAQYDAILGR